MVRFVSVEPLLERIDYFDRPRGSRLGHCWRRERSLTSDPWIPSGQGMFAGYARSTVSHFGISKASGLRPGQHDTLDGVRYHELPEVREIALR